MFQFEDSGYIFPEGAERKHRIAKDEPVFLPDGTLATIIFIEDGIAYCAITRIIEGGTEVLMASAKVDELTAMPKHPVETMIDYLNQEKEEDDGHDD